THTGPGARMILLTLAWSLLMASQASDVNLILEQDKPVALYPDLFSEALIHCTDGNLQPDAVYWFRTLLPAAAAARAQFLGKLNNADVFSPGEGVSRDRFKSRKKTKNVFSLKIINVTEEDAGLYSCVMKDRKATEVWKPGVLLLPGVIPPTSPPTTTTRATVRHICRCSPRADGCGPLVLWPLVGTAAALALTLLCTLYYFSRLPKKCRHRFVKKRQLT
uniref:Cd8 beta n=1 Tax=Tetraodon nigroviridis TaxID=99883 RepID=H3BW10_TETNG